MSYVLAARLDGQTDGRILSLFIHIDGSLQRNVTQRAINIWGFYITLIGEGEGEKGTHGTI